MSGKNMCYMTEVHEVGHDDNPWAGWIAVGYHSDPEIVAAQLEEAKAALEAGEFYGHPIDAYQVRLVDDSDWYWD